MRISGRVPGEGTDGWFDDPLPDDRRSWAVPPGHGTYQGLDLERLDPDDEDERTFLLQAQHLEMEEGLEHHEEMTGPDGEPVNIRPSWNKGYATEAAIAVLAHGLGPLGLDRIMAVGIAVEAVEGAMPDL
jgi:hypothetical protein